MTMFGFFLLFYTLSGMVIGFVEDILIILLILGVLLCFRVVIKEINEVGCARRKENEIERRENIKKEEQTRKSRLTQKEWDRVELLKGYIKLFDNENHPRYNMIKEYIKELALLNDKADGLIKK